MSRPRQLPPSGRQRSCAAALQRTTSVGQKRGETLQTPRRTHWPRGLVTGQSAAVVHWMTVLALSQALTTSHGPNVRQSVACVVGSLNLATPGCTSGKYCRPTLSPVEPGSVTKDRSAARTASHFVVTLSEVSSSIDPELSSMM